MRRPLTLAFFAALLALPSSAMAQRGRHSGPIMTADGPVSPAEWRAAGGNPIVYQQLMEQKQMAAQEKAMQQQYQAMQKQQVAYDNWLKDQKAKKDKGKPVDPAYQSLLDEKARYEAAIEARAAKAAAKKKGKTTSSTKKTASPKAAASSKPAPTTKPATVSDSDAKGDQ